MAERKASTVELLKESETREKDLEKSGGSSTSDSGKCPQDIEMSAASGTGMEKSGESSTARNSEAQKEIEVLASGSKKGSLTDSSGSSASKSTTGSRLELLSGYSTSACEASEVAKVAANSARNAATSCRRVMTDIVEAIATGKKQVETALQRAENAAELDDVNHYQYLAAKYGAAIVSASMKANDVETAADAADVAAHNADEAARILLEPSDESSQDERDKIKVACWAANTANAAAIVAFKMEFIALKAMKKCWQHIDDAENMGSTSDNRRRLISAYGQNCNTRRENRCVKIANIIVFILGCSVLISLEFINFSEDSYRASMSLGLLMIIWPALHGLYKLWVCYEEKKLEVKLNKTRKMIAKIDDRLKELSAYFENNSISPVSSDESEED